MVMLTEPRHAPPTPAPSAFRRSRRPAGRPGAVRLVIRWFSVLCLPLALLTVLSLFSALTRPGNLSLNERFVEWVRDHHGGQLVNRVEHWYYSRHQPKVGGHLDALPGVSVASPAGTGAQAVSDLPSIAPLVAHPLPDEGQWHAVGDLVGGKPVVEVTYMRPDAVHTGIVAVIAHIDMQRAKLRLVPGRTEPGHDPWPGGYGVPLAEQGSLLAAFNSGFRMQDARGGFYLAGKSAGSLREGAASMVVHSDGTATVAQWGRDAHLTKDVVAVRQNLALIVDNGQLVPGLDNDSDNRWGLTVGNKLFVWRSGVGVDAAGNLLYVAGDGLSVHTLADLLQRAGAVRAMELDINHSWVSFNVFPHDAQGQVLASQATKLLDGMKKPATRYLSPDDRDFFAVLARPS
jgi:hypothetical protein